MPKFDSIEEFERHVTALFAEVEARLQGTTTGHSFDAPTEALINRKVDEAREARRQQQDGTLTARARRLFCWRKPNA